MWTGLGRRFCKGAAVWSNSSTSQTPRPSAALDKIALTPLLYHPSPRPAAHLVLPRHLVELVDAAHAAVAQHDGARLKHRVACHWVAHDADGEARAWVQGWQEGTGRVRVSNGTTGAGCTEVPGWELPGMADAGLCSAQPDRAHGHLSRCCRRCIARAAPPRRPPEAAGSSPGRDRRPTADGCHR